MVLEECEILVLSLLFKTLLCCSNSAAHFFYTFQDLFDDGKVSASYGPGSSRFLLVSILFKTFLALICMLPISLHIVNSISTLCHFVSTLLLPCNNIFCIGMVADHIFNKYSKGIVVLSSMLLYFVLILTVTCMQ